MGVSTFTQHPAPSVVAQRTLTNSRISLYSTSPVNTLFRFIRLFPIYISPSYDLEPAKISLPS